MTWAYLATRSEDQREALRAACARAASDLRAASDQLLRDYEGKKQEFREYTSAQELQELQQQQQREKDKEKENERQKEKGENDQDHDFIFIRGRSQSQSQSQRTLRISRELRMSLDMRVRPHSHRHNRHNSHDHSSICNKPSDRSFFDMGPPCVPPERTFRM